jgi:dienelactone hydrolase
MSFYRKGTLFIYFLHSRIGTFGLSVGGGLSLALATDATKNGKPLQATVTFYGVPSQDVFDTTLIRDTPIQGHFGGKVKKNRVGILIGSFNLIRILGRCHRF